MKCRFCEEQLSMEFLDLGHAPASNSFLSEAQLKEPETYFPLKVFVCGNCFLVQVDEYKKSSAIFDNNYVYFSSYSKSWLKHAEAYVEMAVERFSLDTSSQVVEIASNDGYLLQYFVARNIPVLGVEPTSNTAAVAIEKGVPTEVEFFGEDYAQKLAGRGIKADLLLGNNVLAHVPNIIDFVKGLKLALADDGVITMEFPHLMQLVENSQFDTIYHEHFSYLSLYTVGQIFISQGLEVFDVEEIETHGGSLRIFAKHKDDDTSKLTGNVAALLQKEIDVGVNNPDYYKNFREKSLKIKTDLLSFLLEQQNAGKTVMGYGAAAKGNTLLNYCGVKNDIIEYVVDANPNKQNMFLPGSHIKVVDEQALKDMKPDYVVILPWNIKDEVVEQLSYIKEWGGEFVVFVPELTIC